MNPAWLSQSIRRKGLQDQNFLTGQIGQSDQVHVLG